MSSNIIFQDGKYREGEDDQDAECVLVWDEDHQYELDEVHQALEASLDPAHRACAVRGHCQIHTEKSSSFPRMIFGIYLLVFGIYLSTTRYTLTLMY